MQKVSKVKLMLWSIVFLVIFILLIWLFNTAFSRDKSATYGAPKNAKWSCTLNLHDCARLFGKSVLFNKEDEEVFQWLKDKIPTDENEGRRSLGVKLDSKVLIFEIEKEATSYLGLVFNVINERKFKERFFKHQSKAIAVRNDVGLVLVSKKSSKKMETFARQCLDEVISNVTHKDVQSLLSFNSVNFNEETKRIQFETFFENNQFRIDGELEVKNDLEDLNFDLRNEGVYFQSCVIPRNRSVKTKLAFSEPIGKIIDFPENWVEDIQMKLEKIPNISAFVLTMNGTKLDDRIENLPNTMGFFPFLKFNSILRFNNEVEVSQLVDLFPEYLRKDNFVQLNKEKLFFIQLDSKTVFVGRDKSALIRQRPKYIAEFKGDPRVMYKLEGSDLFRQIVSAMPQVNAMNRLVSKCEKSNFWIEKTSNKGKLKINAKLNFKKDVLGPYELIRLLRYSIIEF